VSLLNVEELEKKLAELNTRLNEINDEVSNAYNELNELKKKLNEKRSQLSAIINQLNGKRGELNELKGKVRELVEKRNSIIDHLKRSKAEKDEVTKRITQLRDRLKNLRELLRELEATGGRVQDKDKLKVLIEKLEFEHDTSPSDLKREMEFYKTIVELGKNLERAETLDELRGHIADTARELEELVKKRAELVNDLKATYEGSYKPIKDELAALKGKINEVRNAIGELKKRRDELKAERDELKRQILAIYARIKELKESKRQVIDEINKNRLLLVAARKSALAAERRRSEEAVKSELKRKAMEALQKLERGERVSLDELMGLEDSEDGTHE
jgi:uncharacterized coiled-coil DUF342 family protein